MDETSTFLAAIAVLTGPAAEIADDDPMEGVGIGEEGELVAKATEAAADLNGKIIPVKGKRMSLAGEAPCLAGSAVLKGATAAPAKVAW